MFGSVGMRERDKPVNASGIGPEVGSEQGVRSAVGEDVGDVFVGPVGT
jgi:hypothetical protein